MDNWMKSHIRQMHMDFHMPEFPLNALKNFKAKEYVEHLVYGNINMVALFAKCHFGNSFYNTKVGHKHNALSGDYLMETVLECKKHNIKTVAYYSLCTDVHAYNEHTNWRYVDQDGKYKEINGPLAPVCINTSYKEELVLPQFEEIIKDYPVDGIFIDIPSMGECFCESCKRKFFTMFNKELTTDISEEERLGFNHCSAGRLLKELNLLLKKNNKEYIKVITNGAWETNFARYMAENSECGVWETHPVNNYLGTSFAARSVRTLDRDVQVMSVRFFRNWGDLTLKPTAQMITEFAAMIGNGCPASSGDQTNVDGSLQLAVYDMFHKAYGFVKEREDILISSKTITETAILAPVKSKYLPGKSATGDEVRGAHKALVDSHIQFDILNSLDINKLNRYKYIILPEPCSYADEVFPALREWVKDGGTIVAVGKSLLNNGKFELEDVFGIEYIEPSVFPVSHFIPCDEVKGDTDDLVLQLRGEMQKVNLTDAAEIAKNMYPMGESTKTRAFRNPDCPPPSDIVSPNPFATVNTYGNGKAIYIAGSIFKVYWEYNHHWLRQFIEAVIHYVNKTPLYKVDAPTNVETNIMQCENGDLLLNFIHYQIGHQGADMSTPSMEKVFPITGIHCAIKIDKIKKLILEPSKQDIQYEIKDGYAHFDLPSIHYMAMVRIVR